MKATFIALFIFGAFIITTNSDGIEYDTLPLADASEEFNRYQKDGSLKAQFRETHRLLRIHAYMYAMRLTTGMCKQEFFNARFQFPGQFMIANETWRSYISQSQSPSPQFIRNILKTEEEYARCGQYLAHSFFIANRQNKDHVDTVQVMSKMAAGTNLTIEELLRGEKTEHLFTPEHIKYLRILAASVNKNYPVYYELLKTDEKTGTQYVIPLARGPYLGS